MSKLHEVQVTGDKVEVVEWVGEEPKPAEYAERLGRRITYEQAYQTYLLDKADATRYSTLESDRDYWLAKKGVFGEEEFGIVRGEKKLDKEQNICYGIIAIPIPRKEDDAELATKLKQAMIDNLQAQITDDNTDKPYLIVRSHPVRTYTLTQLIEEVRNETEEGVKLINGIIKLSIDLLHRGKKELP